MHDVGVARQDVEPGDEGVLGRAAGRAGSSGSRRCRRRWARTGVYASGIASSDEALPRPQRLVPASLAGAAVVAGRGSGVRVVGCAGGAARRRGAGSSSRGCSAHSRRAPGARPSSSGRRAVGGSSRRPAHRAAAQHVQVGVEDGLVGGGAGVEHQPVALVEPSCSATAAAASTRSTSTSGSAAASAAAFGWWLRGITSTWVGACGFTSRNATVVSVSCTTSAGMSPATILQNRQSGSASVHGSRAHSSGQVRRTETTPRL